jgi:hypothetical protein
VYKYTTLLFNINGIILYDLVYAIEVLELFSFIYLFIYLFIYFLGLQECL